MKRTPLKKASKAYAKALATYRKHTKPMWLEDHSACQYIIGGPFSDYECGSTDGCTVHHTMRRGKYLNDMSTFLTLCPRHHKWVEDHKREARKLGYILYK